MNRYFEIGVARQQEAKTVEEAKENLHFTCEGWYQADGTKTCGCHFQTFCDESKCPVMRAHRAKIDFLETEKSKIKSEIKIEGGKFIPKKKQILSPQYKAKRAIVKYLDRIISKAYNFDRNLVICLENITVQIYTQKDLYKAMEPLKEKYSEIFYKAAKLYWKYGV